MMSPEEHREAAAVLARRYAEAMARAIESPDPNWSEGYTARQALLFYWAADCCAAQAAAADRYIREAAR